MEKNNKSETPELVLSNNHNNYYLNPVKGKHEKTLIWMHGLGDSAKGWIPAFK